MNLRVIWPVLWSLETFWGKQLPLVLPSLGKEMAVVWMAIMMWVTEAEGWCWWHLWTPWSLPQAIFKKLKPIYMCLASTDLLQRCLRCARGNAEFFYGLVWSYCVELIQWHACSLVVLQFNNCMCQGHTGCTAGGYGLLSWRVQHKCTGTRGQDVYSQEWEEDRNTPWEQGK